MAKKKTPPPKDWFQHLRTLAGRKEIMLLVYDEMTSYQCTTGQTLCSAKWMLDPIAVKIGMSENDFETHSSELLRVIKQFKEQWLPELSANSQLKLII